MRALELKIHPPYLWLLMGLPAVTGELIGLGDWQLFPVILLLGSAVTLGLMGLFQFYCAKTTYHPHVPHQSKMLVTSGVYQISRNPMYLGLLMMLTALYLGFQNPLGWVFVPLFVLWLQRFQISVEERVLAEKFGSSYQRYCDRVRRWC